MSSKENIVNEDCGDNSGVDQKKSDSSDSKLIRVLTVVAYLVAVSTPALILSSYYIFIWDSTSHFANNTHKR